MKKYFSLICAILLALTLSSCGVKKELSELELEGRKISASSAEDMIEDWEKYKEELTKEEEIFDNWISVDINSIYKYSDDDGNQETYMNLSGKIYESYYEFDTKMSLTLKFQGTKYDKESTAETEYRGTVDIIYIDGKAYYNVSITSKTSGDYESTTEKHDELIVGDINDLSEISGLSVFAYNPGTSYGSNGISMLMSSLINIQYEDEYSKAYQDEEVYSFSRKTDDKDDDSSSKTLSQLRIEMNEEYEVKSFESFNSSVERDDDASTETITSVKYKKCLGALIIKPLNYKKYTEESIYSIINDIIGGNR